MLLFSNPRTDKLLKDSLCPALHLVFDSCILYMHSSGLMQHKIYHLGVIPKLFQEIKYYCTSTGKISTDFQTLIKNEHVRFCLKCSANVVSYTYDFTISQPFLVSKIKYVLHHILHGTLTNS